MLLNYQVSKKSNAQNSRLLYKIYKVLKVKNQYGSQWASIDQYSNILQVEVASKEPKDAFINRENDDPMMLRYPKRDEVSYQCKLFQSFQSKN